jgi:hypothetical protein
VLRVPPGWDAEAAELALELDGEDVTGRCALRTDRMWPPRRVELVLRAVDLAAGAHEAVVGWRGADGAPHRHAWAFGAG